MVSGMRLKSDLEPPDDARISHQILLIDGRGSNLLDGMATLYKEILLKRGKPINN